MLHNFSDNGKRVIVLAKEIADDFKHNYIGTEHLLAALSASNTRAGVVLRYFNLNITEIHAAITDKIGTGSAEDSSYIPFTLNMKEALSIATQEFQELQDEWIEDTHLLMGLLGMEKGIGREIILSKVENVSIIRETLLKDMTISRAVNSRAVPTLDVPDELEKLIGNFISEGAGDEATEFQRGQAHAAQQILKLLMPKETAE